jgi:hypothetical protein
MTINISCGGKRGEWKSAFALIERALCCRHNTPAIGIRQIVDAARKSKGIYLPFCGEPGRARHGSFGHISWPGIVVQ